MYNFPCTYTREVVPNSEVPLSEAPLYYYIHASNGHLLEVPSFSIAVVTSQNLRWFLKEDMKRRRKTRKKREEERETTRRMRRRPL